MQIIHSIAELRSKLNHAQKIAFVPTMGNLHEGHLHLIDIAKLHADFVVSSIFVNPLQFGKNEDFTTYPRTFEEDCDKLSKRGTHIVFAPTIEEIYPDFDGQDLQQGVTITPPAIADTLCGASRPGHFSGVATVVLKLFNIVQPDTAVFGKKDFQQLFIIRQLVRQLNIPIEIIAGETVRETDGLAMSSRNGYLNHTEREQAAQLYQSLKQIANAIQSGEQAFERLERQAAQQLNQTGWQVDYIAIRSAVTLMPAKPEEHKFVVLGAAKLGKTRLIDNIEFCRSPRI
jgi:pantoate--beta-alanine ligase